MNFILQAEDHNTHMQELNKFVHYYTRFKNHENSYKVHLAFINTALFFTKDRLDGYNKIGIVIHQKLSTWSKQLLFTKHN